MEKLLLARAWGTEEDLDSLKGRHLDLEKRLATLDKRISLTSDEQVERARLKKEKLRIKDRILAMTARGGPTVMAPLLK